MKKTTLFGVPFLLLLLMTQSAYAAAREWEIDSVHSNIYFSIDHIYAKIRGDFSDFTAKINFDPADLPNSRFIFQIAVSSIDTHNSKRDKDLASERFFDAEKYPTITFASQSIKDAGNGIYEVAGKLTIKGKEHDLTLPLTLAGIKDHPAVKGKQVIGFNGKVTVDRLALGVGDETLYRMGMVGKDVNVFVSIEALSPK